jgi:hypothetical protein
MTNANLALLRLLIANVVYSGLAVDIINSGG